VIDLRSFGTRVVECPACDQPVASPRASEMRPACPYCGVEQALPAAPKVTSQEVSPYRGRPRDADGKLLPFELAKPPSGLEGLGKKRDLAKLREAWRETKEKLRAEHDVHTEFRAAWLAAVVSSIHDASGDALRERAVLETALEGTANPVYRAMIGARLARLATRGGALELASAWLEAAPRRTWLPEADSDLEVARALLAHARGNDDEVLERVGAWPATSPVVGGAGVLGAMLRVDVLERRGEGARAYQLYKEAVRTHGVRTLADVAERFRLGARTRGRFHAVGWTALAAIAAIAGTATWFLATR
jgi:hypothetical protein